MKPLSRRLLWLVLLLQLLVMLLVFFSVAMPLAKRSASDLAGLMAISAKTWQELSVERRVAFVHSLQEDTGLTIERGVLPNIDEAWKPHWYADWVEQALIAQGEHPSQVHIQQGIVEALLPQLDASEQKLFSEQIQRMSEQIETALLLAQGEQNRPLPQQSMAQMWQSWQFSFPAVNFVCESDPLLNVTVPKLLERVVQNLIVNAQVHGQGQVSVRLSQQHNGWKLSVTDEGDGIPEAVWKAYQRPQAQGVGLGLLSSLWLAELMALRLTPAKGGMNITPLS